MLADTRAEPEARTLKLEKHIYIQAHVQTFNEIKVEKLNTLVICLICYYYNLSSSFETLRNVFMLPTGTEALLWRDMFVFII